MEDIFGTALLDFYHKKADDPLLLHTTYGMPENVPLVRFFHNGNDFSDLDFFALEQAYGNILDIGACTGRHALYLQDQKHAVSAMDISPSCGTIMEESGLKNILIQDVFEYKGNRFDTLLMLMNGVGLAGSIAGLERLLTHLKTMINPGGQLILDSSDITYLYEDLEKPEDRYFGEIIYRYEYKKQLGDFFSWLYIDQKKLTKIARECGWSCQIIYEDESDAYLARLQLW